MTRRKLKYLRRRGKIVGDLLCKMLTEKKRGKLRKELKELNKRLKGKGL